MTSEEFGNAYKRGFDLTVKFLMSRGAQYDSALETAQAAWVKGWEKLAQLRDDSALAGWMNSIALNIHRSHLRRKPMLQAQNDLSAAPQVNWAALDLERIFAACQQNDCLILKLHYLQGYNVEEIAKDQGCSRTAVRCRLFRARNRAGKTIAAARGHRFKSIEVMAGDRDEVIAIGQGTF
jgi:RNA polymerase sigma-70 factor (ECF subfamily)